MRSRARLRPSVRRCCSLSALILLSAVAGCLDESLIKQPELNVFPGAPAGWSGTAGTLAIGTTSSERHSGTASAYLSNAFQPNIIGNYTLLQAVRADNYRGKRVRLSGWMRPRNVSNTSVSGLWMRIEGPGLTLGFDNMSNRPVFGYGDWRQVAVVLDVPATAIGISFGAQFQATNSVLVDDLRFEVVATDVPTTNLLSAPTASGSDSATTAATFARLALTPTNLDFEGLTPFGSETATWITQNASTLTSTAPSAALDDLEPLRTIVGTAHVVGLGEATGGTREFALLKDRVVRYLVTRMGFTTFAIDASAPEADDINQYLNTGTGDPARWLSRLYVGSLNTQEVANLIAWMRQWNSTAPVAQRVQFRGVDMQSPGASIDSVVAFMHRASPAYEADIVERFRCLDAYRNRGATAGRPRAEYLLQSAEGRQLCAEALTDALQILRTRGAAASGYQTALHHARLVQQFETLLASGVATTVARLRDAAMAENVMWLRDQGGADARVMVWSHNDRLTRQPGSMGAILGGQYGTDYRPIGLLFGKGRFNAVLQEGASLFTVQSHDAQLVPVRSIEDAFVSTGRALLLLDMRRSGDGSAGAEVLRGPIAMRSVGANYNPSIEATYFLPRLFPNDFDALLFVRDGTASTLLPVVN